jgi:uncharacterized membrane protein
MDKWLQIYHVLSANKRLFGALVGVFFGILYLFFGLIKTIVFTIFVALGYFIGKMMDEREDWRDVIDRIMPPKYRE